MDGVDDKTWAALVRALGDPERVRETVTLGSEFLGLSYQEGAERLLSGVLNQRGEALEVLSDDDVPDPVLAAVGDAAAATGQPVTAVKRATDDGGYAVYTTGNPIVLADGLARRGARRAEAVAPTHCIFWPTVNAGLSS